MLKRILIPLDGSATGEAALPYGEELAGRLGASVVLHHFLRPGQPELNPAYLDKVAERVAAEITRQWIRTPEVMVSVGAKAGEPAADICHLVDREQADLIVMTAVSAAGLKIGKMLGSISGQVCQNVSIPVLLVRPQGPEQTGNKEFLINRLLVALDGSPLSSLAVPVAAELSSGLKAGLVIYQMVILVRLYGAGIAGPDYIDITRLDREERQRVNTEMSALVEDLKKRGLQVDCLITEGHDAAAGILDAARRTGTDLLVMSTHGRSGLGKLLLGSVTEKVLRQSDLPLLLVHARAS